MAAESRKVIIAALIGNLMVAITKFVAAAFTGSSAMFLRSYSLGCRHRQSGADAIRPETGKHTG